MMFVDANTVETQAIGEFKLVEVVIVDGLTELGVIQRARDVHPYAAVLAGEVRRQVGIGHQMEGGEFHYISSFTSTMRKAVREPTGLEQRGIRRSILLDRTGYVADCRSARSIAFDSVEIDRSRHGALVFRQPARRPLVLPLTPKIA